MFPGSTPGKTLKNRLIFVNQEKAIEMPNAVYL
jgi:hypothetical protein